MSIADADINGTVRQVQMLNKIKKALGSFEEHLSFKILHSYYSPACSITL